MNWMKLFLRIALDGAAIVLVLALIGAVVEGVLSRREAERFPPPGRLVDIGGRRLHLQCAGEGSPTLWLEMGAGEWGLYWTSVLREMSKVVRVCAYDRAGYGWSDPGPLPRTPDALLADLRGLIEASGEEGPFIFAGHSLGGWLIRAYQARHPEDVAGMALVESAHPKQWRELPPEIWAFTEKSGRAMGPMAALGKLGALRLLRAKLVTQQLPEDVMAAYRATALKPSSIATFGSEVVNSPALAALVDEGPDLGDLPLVVVSAGKSFEAFRAMAPGWPFPEANQAWARLQRDLTTLSTHSWQHVSPDATHNIQTDDPDLVVRALTELVDTVRTASAPAPTA